MVTFISSRKNKITVKNKHNSSKTSKILHPAHNNKPPTTSSEPNGTYNTPSTSSSTKAQSPKNKPSNPPPQYKTSSNNSAVFLP